MSFHMFDGWKEKRLPVYYVYCGVYSLHCIRRGGRPLEEKKKRICCTVTVSGCGL